jgi:hypothetical protein
VVLDNKQGEEGAKRLNRQFRRLRNLSEDVILPISKNPSFIDEAFSPLNAETGGQRVTRVLRDAYDEVVKICDRMRKLQVNAYTSLSPKETRRLGM